MADWLAYGLEDALADTPEFGVVRKHRTTSGLLRYEPRSETPNWAQAAREIVAADKPNFIVVMLGLYDRQSIRESLPPTRGAPPPAAAAASPAAPQNPEPEKAEQDNPDQPSILAPEPQSRTRAAGVHEFRTEKWAELYGKRIDDMIAAVKNRGVPVFWVGLPSVRGARSTSDTLYLNDLFRTRAEKAGIVYIDVWDGFVDEQGRFALQGPDFDGQTRRLRAGDGVHFTKSGARKLAHYVEREIKRASLRGSEPVALPSSEPQPQVPSAERPGGATPRPLAGPVVPLTASATTGESLLGGVNAPNAAGHVTATRVLVKGEAVASPAGRADDFAWPRRGVAAFGTDPVVATTTLPLPVMQAPPAKTTVPVPDAPAIAAAAAVRRAAAAQRPQQQQPQPASRGFSPFPFFPFFPLSWPSTSRRHQEIERHLELRRYRAQRRRRTRAPAALDVRNMSLADVCLDRQIRLRDVAPLP